MLAETDPGGSGAHVDHDHGEPRGSIPGVTAPLCDRAEYEQLVEDLVAESAPRMFAVVQDYGDRLDSRVAAWGLAFEDYAEIVGVDRGLRRTTASPERALRGFTHRPDVTARVLWVHLGSGGHPDETDPA